MAWFVQTQKDSASIWILSNKIMGSIIVPNDEIYTLCSHYVRASNYKGLFGLKWDHNFFKKLLIKSFNNIPDELIINVDQTASTFVATGNTTMAAKGEKHISRVGATYKKTKTVTLWEYLDGCMLPFQLILYWEKEKLFNRSHFSWWILLSFQSETLE